jgi:transcriptional regulator with XRE-family HTH domain
VTEDWAAVGAAVKQRRTELGFTQVVLGERAVVSKQVVYELENEIVRRRSPRTLSALSKTLGWHDGHLAALLAGRLPPRVGDPVPESDEDIPGHISMVEHYLLQLLDEVHTVNVRLNDLSTRVDEVSQRTRPDDYRKWR